MSIANKIVVGLVGLTVMAVIFSAMLPIMGEVTSAEDTFVNDGYYRMSNTEDETVIIWSPSTNKDIVNVNGNDISLAGLPTGTYSVAFSDDVIVRFNNQDSYNFQIWNSSYATGLGGTSQWDCTVTINTEGVKFKTSNPESSEQSITHTGDYFVIDPNGDYIMKDKSKIAYLLKDSSIFYGGGISLIYGSTYSGMYLEGTVDNCTVSPMSNSVTASDVVCVYTDSSSHEDLVSLEKITFTTTFTALDESTTDVNQTYNYFLVPYEVTAEKSIHPDGPTTAILNMLPIIIGAGLLLGAIAFMIVTRK